MLLGPTERFTFVMPFSYLELSDSEMVQFKASSFAHSSSQAFWAPVFQDCICKKLLITSLAYEIYLLLLCSTYN